MFQMRPMGGDVGRAYYSPDRDVAYKGMGNIISVLNRLDDQNPVAWLRGLYLREGVTYEQLVILAQHLARFTALISDSSVEDFPAAWEKAELEECNPAALTVFLAEMGRTYLAAFFCGCRELGDEARYKLEQDTVERTVAALQDRLRQPAPWKTREPDWLAMLSDIANRLRRALEGRDPATYDSSFRLPTKELEVLQADLYKLGEQLRVLQAGEQVTPPSEP